MSQEKQTIMRVVENFARSGQTSDEQVKVTCLPDNKTSVVEGDASGGRSVMLDEYKVDGRIIWAGYSTRSGTVYLSAVSKY